MLSLKPNAASGWGSGLLDWSALKAKMFSLALLLVAVAVFVPFAPGMPWESLDPSWEYGMNEAVAQGMAFGKDIVFTFGPYASIYTKAYHPATDHLMILGSLYLAISFSIVVYLNFKSTTWLLKITLLAVLSTVMYSRDALFFFYPMLVGVHVYRYAISLRLTKSIGWRDFLLIAVLFAPFGLFPLIKGSALIACSAIAILCIALLAQRVQWKLCLLIGATPLVSLIIFWVLSGQTLSWLADYFLGLAPIISGYTEAMATDGDPKEYILYAVATAVLAGVLLREAQGSVFDKLVIVSIFLCILFLAFKAGFVRHDGHAIISGTMILLGALLACTLLTTRYSLILVFASTIAWAYIDAAHIKTSTHRIKENFNNTYSSAWTGLKQRIVNPDVLAKMYEDRVNELNARGGFPKLNGSVDIYSYDQSYLIASGNSWNPRPILQSYSAYTSKLANKNRMHLVSDGRPVNVIFKVQPIDGRLPSLEDGASWPVLLSDYDPVSFEGGYLFLRNRNVTNSAFNDPKKIGGGFYSLGEKIDLPKSDRLLYAKINIRKSFVGTILNTLFKPGQLAIRLTMTSGVSRDYRVIAGMSESGFLLSPLVENTQDLALLYAGEKYVADKRVKSIEILATTLPLSWRKSFEIEFYEFSLQPSPGFIEKMDFAKPRAGRFEKINLAQRCDGNIDYANGVSPVTGLIRASSFLNINGWLAASVDPSEVPENVYLVLSGIEGKLYFIDTRRTQRPDVGAHFKNSSLNSSGYTSAANVSELRGDYSLGLAYSRSNQLFVCSQFNIPVKIGQE